MDMLLKVERIYAWYGRPETPVLADVSASFTTGINALLGPNGSGKTTLLRVILGVHNGYRGEVYYKYNDSNIAISSLGEKGWAAWRAKHVGILPQEDLFFEHMSILENVLIAHKIAGIDPDRDMIKELAETLGIYHLLNRRPSEISGGERRKAGLLRALSKPTASILVLDEPTSSLDSGSARMVSKLLTQLSKNKIVIIATHDPIMADVARVKIHLRAGRVEHIEI